MQDKHILVAGYGKLGRRVALNLAEKKLAETQRTESLKVTGVKRSPQRPDPGVNLCFADLTHPAEVSTALTAALPEGVDYLLYCLSPAERTEAGYRAAYLDSLINLLAALPEPDRLKHVLFVSSTSVYHQASGEWVDESTPCEPSAFSGKVLLEAERYLQQQAVASTVVRFSGIYGGGRSRLISQVRQALQTGEPLAYSQGFTNRIHEDDCVGFLCHLMNLLQQGEELAPVYIGTDSEPAAMVDVYQFISAALQDSLPPAERRSLSLDANQDNQQVRRAGSKRCANRLMLSTGYQLNYPSYRQGYARLDQAALQKPL